MRPRKVTLAEVALPAFGLPDEQPRITKQEYEERIEAARSRAAEAGLDFLVVYGDREHFANLCFLTGHDPRFEEALLVISTSGGKPALLVGNEGFGYSELSPVDLDRKLCQVFSLPGQSRSASPRLEPIVSGCGIRAGSRIGLVGWKYATAAETADPAHWLEVPTFIVESLRELAGGRQQVVNFTATFVNPVDGLRATSSVDQLAAFEFSASHASQAVRDLIAALRPGLTELRAVQNMRLTGLPQCAHLMFSTGPRAHKGLPSPSTRTIERGDPFFAAYGLWGGLSARAGFVAEGAADLPAVSRDSLDRLVKPYFAAAVAWYETVGIGVPGGELQAAVDEALHGHDIELPLNPGHLIHLDEWVDSPIFTGSQIPLRSGMAIQCDIIPVVDPGHHTANVEDTIALADADLRAALQSAYPALWERVQARRSFMQDVLGIRLRLEVLPFSNLAGALQPYVLAPELAMTAG